MRILLISLLALFSANLAAQSIKGRITDAQAGAPLVYATISLFSKTDSAHVDGAITGEGGIFTMDARPGSYFARLEFLAYEPLVIEGIVLG